MLELSQVQAALVTAIGAAIAPVPVRDNVGPDRKYPYVSIGECTALPDDPLTRGEGVDMDWSVHVWSRQPGMQEIQQLMQGVKTALHYQIFTVAGAQWVRTEWQFGQTLRDADGITRHGVMRFRVSLFTSD